MGVPSPEKAYDLLQTQHKLADLVALARDVIEAAAKARKHDWADAERVKKKAEELGLERDSAKTEFGNALDVLERAPEGGGERALAAGLWARVLADAPPSEASDAERIAADVVWLAVYTPFDATTLLDHALGDRASEIWVGIAERVRRIDARKEANARAEALLGCAALAGSTSKAARKQLVALSDDLEDDALLRIVRPARDLALSERPPEAAPVQAVEPAPLPAEPVAKEEPEPTKDAAPPEPVDVEKPAPKSSEKLSGELLPPPRGPVATAALAFTGLLFLLHALRLAARLALAYRRPTEVTLDQDTVRVHAKTILLGRTLRDTETVIKRGGLVRATREVRYPRVAFYAGLLALAAGSYLGVRTLVDGARAASPSLLLAGLGIVALGIALDFALTSIGPTATGKCRMLFVPKKGPSLCIGNVDAKRADKALDRLAHARG